MFIPAIEKQNRETIIKFQEDLLQKNLEHLNSCSKFYKELFEKHSIDIKKVKILEDLQYIPFTTKEDIFQLMTTIDRRINTQT